MIGISKLYCGTVEASDPIRYGRKSKDLPAHLLQFSSDKKPVVVWNITRDARAVHHRNENELTTQEGFALLDDLAEFGAPVILFSGGEPTVRPDLTELANYAVGKGMRAVISSNGTLIDKKMAGELKKVGVSYVGISLDGLEEVNDHFRGMNGAFKMALQGIDNCREAGIKVGLRFTINQSNKSEVPGIFNLMEEKEIERICFYHLVYSGRGSDLIDQDLSHEATRKMVDLIIDKTKDMYDRGKVKEVLTVDNHADGPYLYLRMLREKNPRASEVLKLLKMNGGNSSGNGIGCVSWDGEVYADQFWREHSLGNIRKRPFSQIWSDKTDPFIKKLKDKKRYVKGRCSNCKWLDVCAGNFRARGESVSGDIWGEDPACYLTDEEIGIG